jgi:hypothetical protein
MLPDVVPPFVWHTFDVRDRLPSNWESQIRATTDAHAEQHDLVPMSVTSREDVAIASVAVLTVDGTAAATALPWLNELYAGAFRELAEHVFGEPVAVAANPVYGINLNVQRGAEMRYECHIDSNPIGGLLYATTHAPGSGGELVVANRGDVRGVEEIELDATRIHPVAGHLVFFDARRHSHYVAPLADPSGQRIVAAMNFYTAGCPETARPADLSSHLFSNPSDVKETQNA